MKKFLFTLFATLLVLPVLMFPLVGCNDDNKVNTGDTVQDTTNNNDTDEQNQNTGDGDEQNTNNDNSGNQTPTGNPVLLSINQKLTTAEANDGKNSTMYEALQDVEVNGFSIAEANAAGESKFVWNAKTDRFVMINNNGEVIEGVKGDAANIDLWLVSSTVSDTFSTYYTGAPQEITTSKGFDVGNVDGITQITYNNTSTGAVIIRTNSNDTTLVINTNGTVKHYGTVGKLEVQNVAATSYYEYGKVRTASILAGHFVIEENACVTLLVAKNDATVSNDGIVEAYVGAAAVLGAQPGLKTSSDITITDDTVAIIKGTENDEAVTSLPSILTDATVILLKDYDYDKPQVTISGNTKIYGNMSKLNAKVVGDESNVLLKNIHTTGIKIGDNNGFSGTIEFDGGQLDYDGVNFSNGEGAAFYARTGYGTYRFKNMTISTGTNKGIKISKAKEVLVENCIFDARCLSAEGITGTSQNEVYNRSLSCIDIQVQNGALGAMDITIRGNTFVSVPKGDWTNGVTDTDSAGAIKLKTEAANSLESVLIENNTFTNCYRDIVVGVNIRLTSGYSNLNFPAKNPATLKDEQNNVNNAEIYTISNNISTFDATSVADRGVLIVDDQRVSGDKRAYAEKIGEMMGGCAVFNTYKSEVITLETTIDEIDALFADE
ncbi:MAG: hypothetical protein IKQ31_02360 [Clostridia bacterium]|nr:hypothetical protein [Clostridia bacterium]